MNRVEVRISGNETLPFAFYVRPDSDNPTFIKILMEYHELAKILDSIVNLLSPDGPQAESIYAEAYSKGWNEAMDTVEHGA